MAYADSEHSHEEMLQRIADLEEKVAALEAALGVGQRRD